MYTAPSPFDELTTHRLERPLEELVPAPVVARMRRLRLALMVAGAIGLISWIVFLGDHPAGELRRAGIRRLACRIHGHDRGAHISSSAVGAADRVHDRRVADR